jgi:S1-C subfamily serine protease
MASKLPQRIAVSLGVAAVVLVIVIILTAPNPEVFRQAELAKRPPLSPLYLQYGSSTVTLFDDLKDEYVLGTGLMIRPGIFVTNWHAIQGVNVKHNTTHMVDIGLSRALIENIFFNSSLTDLAFGEAPGSSLTAIKSGDSDLVKTHDRVILIGAATTTLNAAVEGQVLGKAQYQGSLMLEISGPLPCGEKGCAVFNEAGEFIGFTVRDASSTEGFAHAVTSNDILRFVERVKGSYPR